MKHALTRAESVGLTLTAEAGFISLTAVSVMFSMVFHNIYRQRQTKPNSTVMYRLIREPMDLYLLSLFLANVVQALGAILDIAWISKGEVIEGTFCTAQGVIQQLGETGAAMTTLIIAIHAFVVKWWHRGTRALGIAKIIMAVVWLYIAIFIAISFHLNKHKDYEAPMPYWCWIGGIDLRHYKVQRIFGEYLWLWLTLAFSIVVYFPLSFFSQGNIAVDEQVWWKFQIQQRLIPDHSHSQAFDFLAYPLVYSVLVLPLSVIQWQGLGGGNHIAPAAMFAAVTLHGLSGAFNVALLLTTQPGLLLFKRDPPVNTTTSCLPLHTPAINAGQVSNHSQQLDE